MKYTSYAFLGFVKYASIVDFIKFDNYKIDFSKMNILPTYIYALTTFSNDLKYAS